MAAPHNVEYEAAKFLQKLIHESTDEPAKLATKLYVILQHMKASGKENSMPYQVISRAMETVINQHGLDIDALMSSRVPLVSGSHSGDGARAQAAGCSQSVGAFADFKSGMTENDTTKTEGFASTKPPAAPSSMGHDSFQGCASQRSTRSFDQESPSSIDTRSTNSQSQDRRETAGWEQQGSERDSKRGSIKRKRSDALAVEASTESSQQSDAILDTRKERLIGKGDMPGTFPDCPSIESSAGKGPADSEYWKQGFIKGTTPNFRERAFPGHLVSTNQGDVAMVNVNSATRLDAAGMSHMPMNADRLLQGGNPGNVGEMNMLRNAASRDMGKSPVIQASVSSMPFREHHLKQLRAQCLVFLAFRNGLPPKRLHLEIALGNVMPKEVGPSGFVDGAQSEPSADQGKQQTTPEASSATDVTPLQGNMASVAKNERVPTTSLASRSVPGTDTMSKETENAKVMEMNPGPSSDISIMDEEKKHLTGRGILEPDMQNQPGGSNYVTYVTGVNKQLKPEAVRWTGIAHNDYARSLLPASFQQDLGNRKESSLLPEHDSSIRVQQHADSHLSTSWKVVNGMDGDYHRQLSANDANLLVRNASHDDNTLETQRRSMGDVSKVVGACDTSYMHKNFSPLTPTDKSLGIEEEDNSMSGLASSPKYTLSEKWIMAHQKRKFATEQKWVHKVQKADERIVARFNELKETVTSSEDISAKTRSVIELKKLQLLELQRRLRRNMLSDFFKPIQTEMDRLKSIKKHRIGRRLKHVEKYEQKMKEERQKRIRERQKEFFSEIEVHRERLEDAFKFKRERCKGFNRYVKEFHKRKERIHREKIDRIQREKINLLKINDVEGYLRMVQDAKSDRVNKLLKETEKYLQKLGSKLKEAKSVARQVEMDENRITAVDDSIDTAVEAEDESDQAKHYKESNEKYYLIAHSIKENITEQPSGLVGGKLREYQMSGLRWLLSLYNNHLNGILADEMGLGKTVQVISLLCYLMENKNDRGPFLVVVPSSVLPGWAQELSFWAPGISKIVYAGPPEDRRRLFKENIIHQKFNVLLTTYEYLMNKHDRPKLSKVHWHYIIIDEGHRIKNASCKLNADLKHYHSTHRLLLTGTPLQNNLEELWALLNFLLPNIFNSSEDFSQWFNKPFESNGDSSADQALLSEEENLLIINRLHQVLRPFVLRRLKHKVENQLPEKIERLVRCEASAYQKLLMKRVEENLGALGVSKSRAVHNSVMELRNICNHPYISQLHADQVDSMMPKHYLPPIIRLCGKLEMLDRLLPKLKATNHRVLLFSTMTRLLDVMEEYLVWKQYRYLRLDGHTSGMERGALINNFNNPNSPFFIFLLSIRAGGVGVNLQAADTVIIFDTDWNPQVDLQAQARAHRIGQKKDVLVLRLETVHTVEEQVRAAAEHKLGVANQSITAGFFDNNTSAEDRREYLESLLRESKKEEAAPVLDDDGLNDILARSESEIDVFEAIDQKRREEEMVIWQRLMLEQGNDSSENIPPLPSRLVTDNDLKVFYEAMKAYEASNAEAGSSIGMKRKGQLGGFDTEDYGRGKRAREVHSYEEQLTEEEFEKMCQADSPSNAKPKEEQMDVLQPASIVQTCSKVEELPSQTAHALPPALVSSPVVKKEATPPVKRGRGRPRRTSIDTSSSAVVHSTAIGVSKPEAQKVTAPSIAAPTGLDSQGASVVPNDISGVSHHVDTIVSPSSQEVSPLPASVDPGVDTTSACTSIPHQPKRQYRKGQSVEKNIQGNQGAETVRRRGRKPSRVLVQDPKPKDQPVKQPSSGACAAVATAPTQSNNSLAESSGALVPKSSDGSTAEDSKSSELPVKQALAGVPLITVSPQGNEEPCKSNVLPQGIVNASVEEAGAGTTMCDLKPQEKSDKQIPLDASVVAVASSVPSNVSKGDLLSQGQGASVSESSSALVSGTIPAKAGAELHAISQQSPIASTESGFPGSTELRSGRKQNQKPQSGIEPVRRRGRKRGQPLSKVPEPPVIQDLNSRELLKSTASTVTSTVTYVASPSGAVHVATGSHATVSVVPAVPVSGFMPVSTPLAGVSGSMHHLRGVTPNIPAISQPSSLPSGTPDFPSQIPQMPAPQAHEQSQKGQVGEAVPQRRGRRKSTVSAGGPNSTGIQDTYSTQSVGKGVEVVERKVIATRSRKINVSQPNAQDKTHKGGTSAALASKVAKTAVSSNLSSTSGQSRDLLLVPSPNIGGSTPVKTNEAKKCLGPGHASLMEDVKLSCSPANLPPVSSRGVTNVIVLALESIAPSVDASCINVRTMPSKEECSGPRKDRNSDHSVLVPRPINVVAQLSCDVGTPNLEEEMCAPPGFDTPRSSFLGATVKKSLQSDDIGITKSHDAKTSPVVLALESATLEVGPGSVASQTSNESLTIGNSAQVSGHLSEPQGSQLESGTAAEMMTTGQLEEEVLAPPGFDIPQQSLSETAVAKSLQSHDGPKKQHDPDNSEVTPDGFADIGSDKILRDVKKVSKGISDPPMSSSLASSSSCFGTGQPLESYSMASLDNLSTIGSDSADVVQESIALVEGESLPPGFATSQASLVQHKNDKSSESKESPMRVESFPSKDSTDSESKRIRGETHDFLQTEKAPIVVADVPMVESEQNMAVGDNFKKDESSVDTGESQLCLGASVSKLDDNKRGQTSKLAEKSVEDFSNVMEPLAKSPSSPAFLDGQASDDGLEKPPALASLLVPEDDGSIELTVLSTEDSGFPKESAKNWDAFDDTNGANKRQTDQVTVVADPIEETDVATSIETASISNETSEKTQLVVPALESVLKPADDAITALEPVSNETQGDAACEAQNDSVTVVTYQIKEPDASTLIEEIITVLASTHNEAAEKTQPENSPALGLVSEPEVEANTELSDRTMTDSAHEWADPVTVAAEIGNVCHKDNAASELDIDSCNFVADPIKSVDNCPKENEDIGNAFGKDDAGCEMDIDSHNDVANATELADNTNLSNPDACKERGAQNLLSAGNNETMSAGEIQSHMAFTDSGDDGECHENRNDFGGTQIALSVEASDVRDTSVFESTLEEKLKGSGEDGGYHEKRNDFGAAQINLLVEASDVQVASVFRPTLEKKEKESEELIEESIRSDVDDQEYTVSCDKQFGVDATLSFQNTSSEQVDTDAGTLDKTGQEVKEPKRAAGVDQKYGTCDVEQNLDVGEHVAIILQHQAAEEVSPCQAGSVEILEDLDHAEENAGILDEHLSVGSPKSSEVIKESSDLVEEDFSKLGMAASQTSLVQDETYKPCERKESHIPVESASNINSEFVCLKNKTHDDNMLSFETASVAVDIPLVESGEKLALSENLSCQNDASPVIDADKGEVCLRASVSELDDEKGNINVPGASEYVAEPRQGNDETPGINNSGHEVWTPNVVQLGDDHRSASTPEMPEKPAEPGSNLTAMLESPSSPACLDNKISEEVVPEKSPTLASVLYPENDRKTTVSVMGSKDLECHKEDAEPRDACQEGDSVHEKESDPVSVVTNPKKETDSIEESIAVSTPLSDSESAEITPPKTLLVLGSVSEPGDDPNTMLADSVMGVECLKCPEENVKTVDVCQKDDDACEMDIDSHNSMVDITKENIEVGDACQEGELGCDMDIDSHNVEADVAAPISDTALSTPETCNAGSAQDVFSTRSNETLIGGLIESHMAFREYGKDGASDGKLSDFGGTQTALSIEGAEVKVVSVYKSALEEKVGETGQKDGSSSEIADTVNVGHSAPPTSDDGRTSDASISVLEVTEEVEGNVDDGLPDIPYVVHAGECAPSTSKLDNSDVDTLYDLSNAVTEATEQAGEKVDDGSSVIPDAVHIEDSVPTNLEQASCDDGKTSHSNSSVSEAKELVDGNVGVSDVSDAVAMDKDPSSSKLNSESDEGKMNDSSVFEAKELLDGNVGVSDVSDAVAMDIDPSSSKLNSESVEGKMNDSSVSEAKELVDGKVGVSDVSDAVAVDSDPYSSKLNSESDEGKMNDSSVSEAKELVDGKVGVSDVSDAVAMDSDPSSLKLNSESDEGKMNDSSVSEAKELVDGNVGVSDVSDAVAMDSDPSSLKLNSESDEGKMNDSSVHVTEALEQMEENAGETDISDAAEVKDSVPPTFELNNSDVGKNDSSITVNQPIVDLVEGNVEATDVGDAVDIDASKSENSDNTKTNDSRISFTEATEQVEGNVGATDEGNAEDSVPEVSNSDETKTIDSSIGINEATEQVDRNVGATDIGNSIDVDDSAPVTSKPESSDEAKIKDSTVFVAEVTVQVEGNVEPKDVDDAVDVEETVPGTPKQESSDANGARVSVPEVTEQGGENVGPNDAEDAVDVKDRAQGTSKQDNSNETKANDLSVSVTEVPEQVPKDDDNAVYAENPVKAETNELCVSISEATDHAEVSVGKTDVGQDVRPGNTPQAEAD